VVTMARKEGDDADNSPATQLEMETNYTQIFQHTVELSGTAKVGDYYAGYDPWQSEIDAGMKVLMMLLERTAFYGEELAGSSSVARAMGGMNELITTNVDALSSAALTRNDMDGMFADLYDAGGDVDLIVTGTWGRRKISSFYESLLGREANNQNTGFRMDVIENPIEGRPVDVLISPDCPAGYMYFLSSAEIGFVPYREFFFEELAKTGDAQKGEIVGEWSFFTGVESHHGIISGFSTSA